ncbi:50S ribosomal protein L4 [Kwoniella sp. DSM 27419]
MRSATRLIPTLSQPLRTSVRSRALLQVTRAVATTSTSALRSYATTSSVSEAGGERGVEAVDEGREELVSGQGEDEVPSNISFEDIEAEADGHVDGGMAYDGGDMSFLAPSGSGRFEPVLLPLSSLASTTPTLPSESELVISLPPDVFAQPIRRDILHRCVVWYLSTLRSGTKTTKTRSTVNYSGRKLRPQKGTGRARLGDASSGTLRGGAPIHPIKPKNWAQLLPRKVRELGLKIALSSKLSTGLLRVVNDLNEAGWTGTNEARRALCDSIIVTDQAVDLEPILSPEQVSEPAAAAAADAAQPATDAFAGKDVQVLNRFGPPDDLSILFVYSPAKPPKDIMEFHRVIRNIPGIELMSTDDVQVYHILKYKWLVMEGEAVDAFSGIQPWEDVEGDWLPEVEESVAAEEQRVPA